MPTIEITETDFARLQKLATPFVDTPATTLSRVLDQYEANGNQQTFTAEKPVKASTTYTENNLPPLRHTKILDAAFGDKSPEKMTWDALVRMALISTLSKVASVRELYRAAGANVAEGKKETDGYKYVAAHDFSYQGVSAEDAVKIITRCAKHLGAKARVEFEWRNKDGAYRPGERATLVLAA